MRIWQKQIFIPKLKSLYHSLPKESTYSKCNLGKYTHIAVSGSKWAVKLFYFHLLGLSTKAKYLKEQVKLFDKYICSKMIQRHITDVDFLSSSSEKVNEMQIKQTEGNIFQWTNLSKLDKILKIFKLTAYFFKKWIN